MNHWCIRIAAIFIFGVLNAFSTTIIVVRSPIEISIASDSLGTFKDRKGTVTLEPVCKIYRSGDVTLGVAGLANDPNSKFSVARVIFSSTRNAHTFEERMAIAEKQLINAIRDEAAFLRKNDPANFAALVSPNDGGISIILIGLQNHLPFGIGERFTVSVDSRQGIDVVPSMRRQCPGADCPNGVYTFKLGKQDAVDAYLASHVVTFQNAGEMAARLVQAEIDAHTTGVGGSIDLVRITGTSYDAHSDKKGCPIQVTLTKSQNAKVSKRPLTTTSSTSH